MMRPEIRTAAAPAFLQRGCVNVIGLDAIRKEAGLRWERMRETIYARAESILRQTLGPADFFLRLNDTAYIITMPASEADEARLCCLRVAHELHTSLLGPCELGQLHLARVTSDGDELLLDPVVMPELAALAQRAGLKDLVQPGTPTAPLRPRAGSTNAVPEFQHGFLPVWDARNEAITTYRLITKRTVPQASLDTDGPSRFKDDLALTLASIHFGTSALAGHLQKSERFLLNMSIPHEGLSSPIGRMEITSAFRGLSGEFRPFLLFELSAIPPGVPQSRMGELVAALRPFCRGVFAQIAPRNLSFVAYQGVGLHAIGFSLPHLGMSDTDMRQEMTRLATAAKRLGLLSFVLDVPSPPLLASARSEGITFLSSDHIGTAKPRASAMHRLPAASIFHQGVAAAE